MKSIAGVPIRILTGPTLVNDDDQITLQSRDVTNVAVKSDVQIPIARVIANPFTGPEPIPARIIATKSVVMFESKMVTKARSKPTADRLRVR